MDQEVYSNLSRVKRSQAMMDRFKTTSSLELLFLNDANYISEKELLFAYENFLKSLLLIDELTLLSKKFVLLKDVLELIASKKERIDIKVLPPLENFYAKIMALFFELHLDHHSEQDLSGILIKAIKIAVEDEIDQLRVTLKSGSLSSH